MEHIITEGHNKGLKCKINNKASKLGMSHFIKENLPKGHHNFVLIKVENGLNYWIHNANIKLNE